MTDLIKRLGDPNRDWPEFGHDRREAKDRIEELDARNKELTLQLLAAHGQAADALDKLAKAVEVMKSLQEDMLERSRAGMDTIHGEEYRIVNAGRTAWNDFCATLAELDAK